MFSYYVMNIDCHICLPNIFQISFVLLESYLMIVIANFIDNIRTL